MSLDVWLISGKKHKCDKCGGTGEVKDDELFSANITHNLSKMAVEAGIYKHLWRPEEIGITKAGQLIDPLREGIAKMKADPERFKSHNSENGWGTYADFVPWIELYLEACIEHPEARIGVSR